MSNKPMSAKEFLAALKRLGLGRASNKTAAALGVGGRTLIRYGQGDVEIPDTMKLLIECLLKQHRR